MDGRYGDRIRLRNLQGGNIFEAEVSGKDQARVVLNEKDSPAVMCPLLTISRQKPQKKTKAANNSALDTYVKDATERDPAEGGSSGSLWSPSSRLPTSGRDVRASQVDDLVTIVVAGECFRRIHRPDENVTQFAINNSITRYWGRKRPNGTLANLANPSGSTSLDGQGTTSRTTTLTATLTARVPGNFRMDTFVEGSKSCR